MCSERGCLGQDSSDDLKRMRKSVDRNPLFSSYTGNSGHQPRLGGARLEGIHKSFMVQVVIDWGTLPKSTLGMPDVEMGDPSKYPEGRSFEGY